MRALHARTRVRVALVTRCNAAIIVSCIASGRREMARRRGEHRCEYITVTLFTGWLDSLSAHCRLPTIPFRFIIRARPRSPLNCSPIFPTSIAITSSPRRRNGPVKATKKAAGSFGLNLKLVIDLTTGNFLWKRLALTCESSR